MHENITPQTYPKLKHFNHNMEGNVDNMKNFGSSRMAHLIKYELCH